MLDLVGNPEDRFSHKEADICKIYKEKVKRYRSIVKFMLSVDEQPHFTILLEYLTLFIHIFFKKSLITKPIKKTALFCVFFPSSSLRQNLNDQN